VKGEEVSWLEADIARVPGRRRDTVEVAKDAIGSMVEGDEQRLLLMAQALHQNRIAERERSPSPHRRQADYGIKRVRRLSRIRLINGGFFRILDDERAVSGMGRSVVVLCPLARETNVCAVRTLF
jgi:hypothetical protein